MSKLFKQYQFIDYATQIYLAVTGALIVGFHNATVPNWLAHVGGHVAGLLIVHGLVLWHARNPENRAVHFLRHYYPIVFFSAMYAETGHLNQMFFQGYFDPAFMHVDRWIFHWQPGFELMDRYPWIWLSEALYFAYFSYYAMIIGLGFALYFRDRAAFAHYISIICFVFYFCYLTYIILPVIGPRFLFPEIEGGRIAAHLVPSTEPAIPAALQRGAFCQLMGFIYDHCETPGAAFPSSHVAVALCTLYFSWRYLRSIRFLHALMVLLLCTATVYCHYHYVIDVIAGILTTVILVPLGNYLFRKWQRLPA